MANSRTQFKKAKQSKFIVTLQDADMNERKYHVTAPSFTEASRRAVRAVKKSSSFVDVVSVSKA